MHDLYICILYTADQNKSPAIICGLSFPNDATCDDNSPDKLIIYIFLTLIRYFRGGGGG